MRGWHGAQVLHTAFRQSKMAPNAATGVSSGRPPEGQVGDSQRLRRVVSKLLPILRMPHLSTSQTSSNDGRPLGCLLTEQGADSASSRPRYLPDVKRSGNIAHPTRPRTPAAHNRLKRREQPLRAMSTRDHERATDPASRKISVRR